METLTSIDLKASRKGSYPVLESKDSYVEDEQLRKEEKETVGLEDIEETSVLNHVQKTTAIFKSQQIGEPDLSIADKREIAKCLLRENPFNFLIRFGKYLEDIHLNYFLRVYGTSYEVVHYVKILKTSYCAPQNKLIKRNRRYEAMKRLESTSNYFTEGEMEKREPFLYYQMIGQYLDEKEKAFKNKEAVENGIPSFSMFLFDKLDKEKLSESLKCQQKEEDKWTNEDELFHEVAGSSTSTKRWGDYWEEEKALGKIAIKEHESNGIILEHEKEMLFKEFKCIMQNNFLNGQDNDFNYSDVDSNPDYDCLEIRTQDEEEKYFDEETCDENVCTDTGVVDY